VAILKEKEREEVQKQFEALTNPVKLVMFTQKIECDYCEETRMMVEELATLSNKVTAEIYNFIIDREMTEKYKVDKIPAIAILGVHPQGPSPGEKDYGIRYYGIPAGYEFSALIEDIKTVSSGQSGLLLETKAALAKIEEPVHMQVFTTPT
jgi:glutaredoxin-like protein